MGDIVIRLGWWSNKWVAIIRDYDGPKVIGPELMEAINNHFIAK